MELISISGYTEIEKMEIAKISLPESGKWSEKEQVTYQMKRFVKSLIITAEQG